MNRPDSIGTIFVIIAHAELRRRAEALGLQMALALALALGEEREDRLDVGDLLAGRRVTHRLVGDRGRHRAPG